MFFPQMGINNVFSQNKNISVFVFDLCLYKFSESVRIEMCRNCIYRTGVCGV